MKRDIVLFDKKTTRFNFPEQIVILETLTMVNHLSGVSHFKKIIFIKLKITYFN